MRKRMIVFGFLLLACVILSGCTTRYGGLVPNPQFAYANSNVTPLGHTHAEKSKGSFLWAPELTAADVRGVYNEALKKVEGANLLINTRVDTEFTVYPIPFVSYYYIKYVVDGEAAKMDIGRQELR